MRRLCAMAALAALVLTGCGKLPGGVKVATAGAQTVTVGGQTLVKLGFGAEGGEAPAVAHTADGWLVVYAGTNTGDRHLYSATSADGTHWNAAKSLGTSDFTDQAPCLVADGSGNWHLFFASNRDGNDFQVYHAAYAGGSFGTPVAIAGTQGTDDLAVAYAGGKFVLAAETMGAGLLASTSSDGEHFADGALVADAGFEPAMTTLPDGSLMLAYTHDGGLYARTGKPGAWGTEHEAATGADRLREPALAWAGDHGLLAYCERTDDGYKLHARRFDAHGQISDTPIALPDAGGDARTPGLAADAKGTIGLVWGMKSTNGQQGVIFSSGTY